MSSQKKIIVTPQAPKPIGPYSAGIRHQGYVFTAGQIGIDPQTNEMVAGGIEAETRQVLSNLKNILEAGGSSISQVIKTTVYLRDMADFAAMNAIYATYFDKEPPARTTVQVAGLPKGAALEIEAIGWVVDA